MAGLIPFQSEKSRAEKQILSFKMVYSVHVWFQTQFGLWKYRSEVDTNIANHIVACWILFASFCILISQI